GGRGGVGRPDRPRGPRAPPDRDGSPILDDRRRGVGRRPRSHRRRHRAPGRHGGPGHRARARALTLTTLRRHAYDVAMDDVLPLRVLCTGYEGPDTVEIYALYPEPHGEVAEGELNRLNGMPVGVTDERWPVDEDGQRYAHICTLDLAAMPALAAAE